MLRRRSSLPRLPPTRVSSAGQDAPDRGRLTPPGLAISLVSGGGRSFSAVLLGCPADPIRVKGFCSTGGFRVGLVACPGYLLTRSSRHNAHASRQVEDRSWPKAL
jgi:hypothetical protein